MPSRRWLVLLALPLLPAAAGFRVARLAGDEMSPSLQPGDWALLGPGEVELGDIWLLEDPAEPGRRVLRRVMALPGQSAGWRSGRYLLDGEAPRLREMGRDERGAVMSEGNRWLVRVRSQPALMEMGPVSIPAGRAWLMADERDRAVDSRWWGPVPQERLERELWLRFGPADAWRGWISTGADGPWYTPPPKDLPPQAPQEPEDPFEGLTP
jgi:signal peptidase I